MKLFSRLSHVSRWLRWALALDLVIGLMLLATAMPVAVAAPEISIEQPAATQLNDRVVAWGYNGYGQTSVPSSLIDVRAIVAGYYHTVALKSDRTVVAWGYNNYGQTNVPAGLTGVIAIAAGQDHSIALRTDGTIVAWGSNLKGQTNVPTGLTDVVAIAAGLDHTVALKADGTVVAWGSNANSQTNVPAGLTGVKAIAAGGQHSAAIRSDGTVVAWGRNNEGQTTVPSGLTGVQGIAVGGFHTVAQKSDGTVVAWGYNDNGQTSVPAGLTGVQAIAAGHYYTLALKNDGSVVAWGSNVSGQTDVPVGLMGVQAIAAGGSHTVALANSTVRFGNQTVATTSAAKTFTIKNTSDLPLNITNVSVIGGNAPDFTVNIAGMLSALPAGGQTTFAVNFTPGGDGARATILRVLNNGTNEGTFDIVLIGTGATATEISVFTGASISPENELTDNLGTHNYSNTDVGSTSATQIFTIQNTGNTNLTGLGLMKIGANASDFTISSPPGTNTLAPNATTTFTITFSPTAGGDRNAVVAINSNDEDENPFEIHLNGTGLVPEIAIEQPAGRP